MKNRIKISYFSHAFMMLAFMGAVSACVNDDYVVDDVIKTKASKEGLTISPTVSESSIVVATTRADENKTPSDVDLKEKQLNTLDVFVEPATKEGDVITGSGKFMLQYHLPFEGGSVKEAAENLLANSWRQQGLVMGNYYNVYVAVNNKLTSTEQDLSKFNVNALKALKYDEVTAGDATADKATHDITGKTGLIYKQYGATDDPDHALFAKKEFMMDGVIKGWTPKDDTQSQVFDVTMNRAAAKIVLNLKFPKSFTDELEADNLTLTPENVTPTPTPAWKFNNFAFSAPVFDPKTFDENATTPPAVDVYNSEKMLFSQNGYTKEGEGDTSYYVSQIVTYTYPNSWDAAYYTTKAPSMVVSVRYYTEDGKEFTEHYYRIPLVKNTVTDIKRNYIYVINANIKTRGSESHEDVDPIDDLEYEVLPWNDETNEAAIHSDAESIQHYYFKVNPKVYTLRGDGDQSVILTYLKAENTKVNWKLFTYDKDGNQLDVVPHDATTVTPIRAWFYNASGAFTTTYNDNEQGINWSNNGPTPMGVTIKQSDESTSGSSGTITVSSHALNNKAIKYIRLRVFLDEESTFSDDGVETMYEDIVIRHFPTDNIQNIVGSWSSYIPAEGGTVEQTLTTRDKSVADGWIEQYGGTYTTEVKTETDNISYAEYNTHQGDPAYARIVNDNVSQNDFQLAVQSQASRQAANSEANAIADSGEGKTYYWGTGVTNVAPNHREDYDGSYDYRVVNHTETEYIIFWPYTVTYYDYYKYSDYHSATYTFTEEYILYSKTVQIITTGNWVDWDRDATATYSQQDVKYTRSSIFTAKVYDENRSHIYAIEPQRTGYNNYQYTYRIAENASARAGYRVYSESSGYQWAESNMTGLTNRHMYVIQISSTSANYIMGRPKLGNPSANLSQDDVVSPAFMIASQLGAVSTTDNSTTAAQHCRRYMEVAYNGTDRIEYTGWRLPTPDEISVITGYQQGKINGVTISNANYQAMTPVLTGRYYWSLTGEPVETSPQYSDGPYLRCVRDLTAAEVEALNGFDAIVEKYGTGHIN